MLSANGEPVQSVRNNGIVGLMKSVQPAGDLLREWRRRRHKTQFDADHTISA
jgi:hypothetical protein